MADRSLHSLRYREYKILIPTYIYLDIWSIFSYFTLLKVDQTTQYVIHEFPYKMRFPVHIKLHQDKQSIVCDIDLCDNTKF